MKGRKMTKHLKCIAIVIVGIALGYAIGNSVSVQSNNCEQICSCDEDCQCCDNCSCNHGEI